MPSFLGEVCPPYTHGHTRTHKHTHTGTQLFAPWSDSCDPQPIREQNVGTEIDST